MKDIDLNNIRPLTEFRNKMKQFIKELNTNKKPIVLTQHGKSAAVLIDAEKYQEMQDQIEFLSKVARGLDDYKNKRIHSLEDTFSEVDLIISEKEK